MINKITPVVDSKTDLLNVPKFQKPMNVRRFFFKTLGTSMFHLLSLITGTNVGYLILIWLVQTSSVQIYLECSLCINLLSIVISLKIPKVLVFTWEKINLSMIALSLIKTLSEFRKRVDPPPMRWFRYIKVNF